MQKLKLTCSKKYEKNLKKTFKYVETTNKLKTLIINDNLICNFDPNLYLEQRISRCLKDNDVEINEDDKIKLMVSLNRKTNRFLNDCEQSLFEDFSYLSSVDENLFYEENKKIFEKPYKDVLFEAEVFENVYNDFNIAIIKICSSVLEKYNKDICDLEYLSSQQYNIKNIDYLMFFVIYEQEHLCLITSSKVDLSDFCFENGDIIKREKEKVLIKTTNKCKMNKIICDLKEYTYFD